LRLVAIGFCCALAWLALGQPALAGSAIERLAQQVLALRPELRPEIGTILAACRTADARCLAEALVERDPQRFELVAVAHPTTDWIRWVDSAPSVVVDGRMLEIRGFGRKVERHLEAALDRLGGGPIEVDLRRNRGGDFGRMRDVAAQLLTRRGTTVRRVRVSPVTASAGEVLAAMLVDAGAALCGRGPTAGQAYEKAVLAADHDWRLISSIAPIHVGSIDLTDGLRPLESCGGLAAE